MAYKKRGTRNSMKVAGKVNWSGRTKSGKGTVKLRTIGRGSNSISVREVTTSYRTSAKYGSKRRVLQKVTYTKVIK